jgi:biopolymer transport protein ExbD
MDLLPADDLKPKATFNFAPMIDFLFLMLSLFATLAVTKATLLDTELELVKLKPEGKEKSLNSKVHHVNLSVSQEGKYKWISEFQSYPMESLESVQSELSRQYELGIFPKDKSKTEILLHIDRSAPWEPIAKLLFSIREIGFNAYPIYEGEEMIR